MLASITLSNVKVSNPASISRSKLKSSGISLSSVTVAAGSPLLGGMATRRLPAKSDTPPVRIDIKVLPSSPPATPIVSSSIILL